MKIDRLLLNKLEKLLKISGGVLIEGPKWCGKTFLGMEKARSSFFLDTYDNLEILSEIKKESIILDGEYPRLIDEWQYLPEIWNKIRYKIDKDNSLGMYILTGSSTPLRTNLNLHSGAGRISRMNLSTLTFFEILQNSEQKWISLKDLFDKKKINLNNRTKSNYDINWIVNQLLIGGWPYIIANNVKDYHEVIKNYILSIQNIDTKKLFSLNKNQNLLNNILISISRLNGTELKQTTLLSDLNNSINIRTLQKYFNFFNEFNLLFELKAWSANTRSRYKIRTSPKVYLCDPSIGLNLLNIKTSDRLFKDLNTLGIYFENQVIKDLKVFAQYLDAELYFYRDEKGYEIDAILELDDGRWCAIEIKLGNLKIQDAIDNLLKINSRITNLDKYNENPSFLMVITSGEDAFISKEGVYVVPFTCLKP